MNRILHYFIDGVWVGVAALEFGNVISELFDFIILPIYRSGCNFTCQCLLTLHYMLGYLKTCPPKIYLDPLFDTTKDPRVIAMAVAD